MEEHGIALHRAFHEKALTVAPKARREPGEFWAAGRLLLILITVRQINPFPHSA